MPKARDRRGALKPMISPYFDQLFSAAIRLILHEGEQPAPPVETLEAELRPIAESRGNMLRYPDVLALIDDLLFECLYTREGRLCGVDSPNGMERIDGILRRHGDYRSILTEAIRRLMAERASPCLRKLELFKCERLRFFLGGTEAFPGRVSPEQIESAARFLCTTTSPNVEIHFAALKAVDWPLLWKAVGACDRVCLEHRKRIFYYLTFAELKLDEEVLAFGRRYPVELVFDSWFPLDRLQVLAGTDIYYRVRLASPGPGGFYDDFVEAAQLGHKVFQAGWDARRPWGEEEVRTLLDEFDRIDREARAKELVFVNTSGKQREPSVISEELTVASGGEIWVEGMAGPTVLGRLDRPGSIDGYAHSFFETYHRMVRECPDAQIREGLHHRVKVGREIARWLEKRGKT